MGAKTYEIFYVCYMGFHVEFPMELVFLMGPLILQYRAGCLYSRPLYNHVATLGKSFTHMFLVSNQYILVPAERRCGVMRGWECNRRPRRTCVTDSAVLGLEAYDMEDTQPACILVGCGKWVPFASSA